MFLLFIVFVIETIAFKVDKVGIFSAFLRGGFGPGSYYYPIMIQFIFYFPVIYAIVRRYNFSGVIICGLINFIYEILKYAYEMNAGCYRLLLFSYTLLIAYGCYLALYDYKNHGLLIMFSYS